MGIATLFHQFRSVPGGTDNLMAQFRQRFLKVSQRFGSSSATAIFSDSVMVIFGAK
jgi:hypothetical protein